MCGVAQDVWASSLSTIQKCKTDQVDMLGLLEYLMARLSLKELEFFFVQVWFTWHQRNVVVHGGRIQDPTILNKRAQEFLVDFKNSQLRLGVPPCPCAPSR